MTHLRRYLPGLASTLSFARVGPYQIRNLQRTLYPGQKSLHDMFIDELRDAYDAEKQLTKALPRAGSRCGFRRALRDAFESHLTEPRDT